MKRQCVWIRPWVGAVVCAALILATAPAALATPGTADEASSGWSAWLVDLVAHFVPWMEGAPNRPADSKETITSPAPPFGPTAAGDPTCDPDAERSCTIDPDG